MDSSEGNLYFKSPPRDVISAQTRERILDNNFFLNSAYFFELGMIKKTNVAICGG